MKAYPEAKQILGKVEGAKKILLAFHRDPDEDSVGSNLSLFQVLKKLGKTNVEIISADSVPGYLSFLPYVDRVRKEEITHKDVSRFDLFIALDSSAPHMLTRDVITPVLPSHVTVVVIDHHITNTEYGHINLVDAEVSSTAELLFNLFAQWNIKLNKDIATCLLTGIAGDTGTFRWATTKNTLRIASELVDRGADLAQINFNLYRRVSVDNLRFAARVFESLQFEKIGNYHFVWAAIPREKQDSNWQKKQGGPFSVVTFLESIEGMDFALLITEEESGLLAGGLRSRTDFDVSKIAVALGGGGHKGAAGFAVKEDFEKGVKKIVKTIRRLVAEKP